MAIYSRCREQALSTIAGTRERGFPDVSISTGCAISGLVVDVRQEPKARAPFTRLLKAFVEKIASRFPSRSWVTVEYAFALQH
jgi:hypothetical protein